LMKLMSLMVIVKLASGPKENNANRASLGKMTCG
jgi:hypothetical protein